MDAESLDRLRRVSLTKFRLPERDISWGVPFDDAHPAAMPDSLLSLADHPRAAALGPAERRLLARHEIASIFSASVRFEGILNHTLSHFIFTGDPLDPHIAYMLHVVEEEARHSRMFAKAVGELGVGSYPMTGVVGTLERVLGGVLRRSQALYYLAMLAVEEINDAYFARILSAEHVHPLVGGVCQMHRVEEARHMEFARSLLREKYRDAGPIQRWLVRNTAPVLLALILVAMLSPALYVRSGVADSRRAAHKLWWQARGTVGSREQRCQTVSRMRKLLEDIGAVDAQTRPLWRLAGLNG